MRNALLSLVVCFFTVAGSNAQTVDAGIIQCKGYDDGGYENCWKLANPSGPSDYFNVDFNADCAGAKVVAICVEVCETGAGGRHGLVGLFADDLGIDASGGTPDLGAPITTKSNPTGLPGTFCTDMVAYDVPDVVLGSSNVHAVYGFEPGDSFVWVCADLTSSAGRSFFTTDGYSTPAIPFTLNWAIRIGAIPAADGVLWINGGTSATVAQDGGEICFLFTGCTSGQSFLIFLSNCSGGILLPALRTVLSTGQGAVDDAGITGSICVNYRCECPAPITLCFAAVYLDPCNPKPNGQPSVQVSNEVTLNVSQGSSCGFDACYGQKDDGGGETIWRVQNPSGPSDYFNVHYGVGAGVTNLIGIELASWDFCGTGSSWGAVLTCNTDFAFDPTGGTPNIATPVASATTIGSMSGQSDWSYPGLFYDYPDVPYAGNDLHGVVHWQQNDSCLWLDSDTDFADGTCGEDGASYFSGDGYQTIATQFFGAAWMIKQDWN